ncbi:MAG TPA: hypothetical protein VHK69_01035 [Chitinophagaceae bacterium]|jgi:hypothetical protein|nr:hypothetical protein [Chitinophagaceae bacterium]
MIEAITRRTELFKQMDAFFCYKKLGLSTGFAAYPDHLEFFQQHAHLTVEQLSRQLEQRIRMIPV